MITEGDIMQLHQELSVDIKLGKVEKKEQESMDKEPQNKVTAAESIQVIVQEMIKMDEVHNNKEIDGNLTLGNPPRGDCNV